MNVTPVSYVSSDAYIIIQNLRTQAIGNLSKTRFEIPVKDANPEILKELRGLGYDVSVSLIFKMPKVAKL